MYVLPHLQILLVHILQYHLHKHFYLYIKVMFYMTKVITYIIKSSGPKVDLCGTPIVTGCRDDKYILSHLVI